MVTRIATLACLLVTLAACSGHAPRYPQQLSRVTRCPGDTVMICETESLRGCGCGHIVTLY